MAYFHVLAGAPENSLPPVVRKLEWTDLKYSLVKGVDDFSAMPSHLAFLGLIYPILGIFLAALTFSNNALPLLYPLASGFALVGPFAAIGLYEISRRRELGNWCPGKTPSMSCARLQYPRSSPWVCCSWWFF